MIDPGRRSLTPNAQKLRHKMTMEEKHLWYDFLKPLSVTVNRQKVIGPYIVDFYISSANLVIELDGAQHSTETGIANDTERDTYLRARGKRILRFSNKDIRCHFEQVCNTISQYLTPSPDHRQPEG